MNKLDKKPCGLIFDMDGTLLDTEPLYTIASQKLLDAYQVEFTMALKKRCMGGDSHRSAQIVIDHYKLPLSADAYLAKREIHLLELFIDVDEIGGAAKFISLISQTDIPMGLATSSHQHLCELKLRNKTFAKYFHQVVCGDDPALKRGKPNPDIFLLCAERLGLEPSACIAFEDSPSGIQAARAAGMPVIAINSPYVTRDELSDAELIIDHYDELGTLLNTWNK